jgi:ATP-dependent Lhr-like helicase
LTLDRNLLRELLGQAELESLLEPAVLDELEAELQGLAEDFRARHPDGLHDLLRRVGDLTRDEIQARVVDPAAAAAWLDELRQGTRAVEMRVGGEVRWVAIEDVARYRDGVGAAPPPGLPASLLEPVPDALPSLVARWARTHAPFSLAPMAARLGVGEAAARAAAARLVGEGRLVEGRFRAGAGDQLCEVEILRVLRRRTLAHLRREVSPVDDATFARFLIRWHGVRAPAATAPEADAGEGGGVRGLHRLRAAIERLEGLPLPFSELERAILPARVVEYHPRLLDELGASGELVWVGRGALGGDDGRVVLVRRDRVAMLLDAPEAPPELPPVEAAMLAHLRSRGASFYAQLEATARAAGATRSEEVEAALWSLVWAGLVTNDTFAPLRGLRARGGPRRQAWQVLGGRWSAVEELRRSWPGAPVDGPAGETERAHARALLLLERYGVVSREAAAVDGIAGGFSSLAPVLREMEHVGRVRRGHFVDGLRGAQYAHPGAVDRLRAERSPAGADGAPPVVVLSAIDPANPWGALLPWPTTDPGEGEGGADGSDGEEGVRPRRVAGAEVVLVRGVPLFFVEKGGAKLGFFARLVEVGGEDVLPQAVAALRAVAARRRHRQLRIEQVNGRPALRSPHTRALEKSGFRVEPGHLVLDAAPGWR